MPKLFSLEELSSQLGVSVKTLRREIADGKLKSVKVRGRVMVAEQDVDEYVEMLRK